MPKLDQVISGFIIKSQDLGEADLLLTFFSETQGKVRAVVKSAKKMTSKLSGHLQPYILVQVTLVGDNGLQKVITVQPLVKYTDLISNQYAMHALLAMQELVLRALADGQPNSELFTIYHQALLELNQLHTPILVLTKFYVLALLALGFLPQLLKEDSATSSIFFSISNGQFLKLSQDSDDLIVSESAYELLNTILKTNFESTLQPDAELEFSAVELLTLMTKFTSYQLERELRAPWYFTVV